MNYTFTLTDVGAELVSDVFPPIELKSGNYSVALISFTGYNSFPNVVENVNNKLHYRDENNKEKIVEFPTGSYELEGLNTYILKTLGNKHSINLIANRNTLKTEIKSDVPLDFSKPKSIGPLLGFKPVFKKLENYHLESDYIIDISPVQNVLIECNIADGMFTNVLKQENVSTRTHVIHSFSPEVPSGYKILEVPTKPIYYPVNTRLIENIKIRLLNQDHKLLDFRGEKVTVVIHISSDGS